MSFGIGNDDDGHAGLAALLFGKPLKFTITDPAFVEVKYPITYERTQYIAQAADHHYYLPRVNEMWQVELWTQALQRALDARNDAAGTPSWWLRQDHYPAFMPTHRPDFVFGVAW